MNTRAMPACLTRADLQAERKRRFLPFSFLPPASPTFFLFLFLFFFYDLFYVVVVVVDAYYRAGTWVTSSVKLRRGPLCSLEPMHACGSVAPAVSAASRRVSHYLCVFKFEDLGCR